MEGRAGHESSSALFGWQGRHIQPCSGPNPLPSRILGSLADAQSRAKNSEFAHSGLRLDWSWELCPQGSHRSTAPHFWGPRFWGHLTMGPPSLILCLRQGCRGLGAPLLPRVGPHAQKSPLPPPQTWDLPHYGDGSPSHLAAQAPDLGIPLLPHGWAISELIQVSKGPPPLSHPGPALPSPIGTFAVFSSSPCLRSCPSKPEGFP